MTVCSSLSKFLSLSCINKNFAYFFYASLPFITPIATLLFYTTYSPILIFPYNTKKIFLAFYASFYLLILNLASGFNNI
jgi:hypothetical protein